MATLVKIFDVKLTQEQQQNLDEIRVKRDFFVTGETYAPDGSVKGEWKAQVVKLEINKDNQITTKYAWHCCFVVDGAVKESLSKSYLLNKGVYDADNTLINAKGTVREWAQKHIVSGKLEKEWCAELCAELNARGLRVENEEFSRLNKATNSRFIATITHPYFAK